MRRGYRVVFLTLIVLGILHATPSLAEMNVNKVVGPEKCGECHKDEVAVWRETRHYKSFYELSRTPEARKITKALGIKRIKKDSACLNCHFLQANIQGKVKPIAGVSCESCHSPAMDWIKVHNDYGGKEVKKEDETPEHRAERLKKIEASGMIRPSDLYELASNCYGCHLVPRENLVNKGGHKAGSDFELVAWSQGEVRHNFFRSASGKENMESSPERMRIMFVVGKALELEHALRGVAMATRKAAYGVTMAKRAARAIANLKKIHEAAPIPEIQNIIGVAGSVKLKLNNTDALNAAAGKIAAETKKLAATNRGGALAALDPLLPTSDKYK